MPDGPVSLPGYGGDSNGGLLLLLVGAYLLVAYMTGRLAWLTNAINDVWAQYQTPSAPPAQPPVAPTGARPRTYPAGLPAGASA